MSLGLWIFLIIALLVLVTAGGTLAVAQILGQRFAQRSAESALDANQSTRAVLQQQRYRQLQLIARVVTTDRVLASYLAEAAATRDPASMLDSLEEYQNLLGFDLALALDGNGAVVARTGDLDAAGSEASAQPLVAAALGGKQAFGTWPQGESLYDAAALPLVRNFEQVGCIVVALSINDALARQIQRISGADTVFLVNSPTGPAVAASTLAPTAAAELISSLRLQGDVLGRVTQRGETASEVRVKVQGQEQLAFLAPLSDAGGTAVGCAVALTALEERRTDFSLLQLLLLGLGAGSLIAGFLLANGLARRAAGPVAELTAAARQAAGGDYSAPLPPAGGGDAGRLCAALADLFADLRGAKSLEDQVTRVTRYLSEPARGAARERAQARASALLAIEMRRFAKPKIGYDPEEALARMTRDLQRIAAAAGSCQGQLQAVFGHRALAVFDGDGAALRALAAATEILHLLSERENVFDEPEPPVVALTAGTVAIGPVVWGDQPSTGLAGLPVQQLESLLREASPGEIYLSKDFYAQVAEACQQAGVEVSTRRGLLSPQPLAVLSAELAARVTGYRRQAPAGSFPGEGKSLHDVRPGAVLGERFDILAELGAGRLGTIWKARDRELGDLVVLKMLKPEVTAHAARFEHLKRLIQNVRTLRHPNVLAVLDFAVAEGLPYLALEYVRGLTLRSLLERGGMMAPTAGVYLARQLAAGLEAAHQEGLLHLGLKPENVLIEARGTVRLMDFGLAPPPGSHEPLSGVAYLSPEQLDGQPGDARADVYALGAVLYEVLTGQPPYQGSTVAEIKQQHLMQDPAPAGSLAPDLPPALEQLVARAMVKAAGDRFQSAAELRAALDALGA